MSNLFIMDNGFDISHNIKSTYNDFKEYLEKKKLRRIEKEELISTLDDNIVNELITNCI